MSELITSITPYLPLVYILIQIVAYLLTRNDMLKMYIKIGKEFVSKEEFDNYKTDVTERPNRQRGYIHG